MNKKKIICFGTLVLLFCGSVSLSGTASDDPTAFVKTLVRVDITQGAVVLPQGAEVVAESQGEWVDIIIPQYQLQELTDNHISFTTQIADMDAYHTAMMGSYHTFAEVEDIIEGIADDHSDIVNLFSIGTSYEGRSQWCLEDL